MTMITNHERELRRAREAAEREIRRLIDLYEAVGRDYRSPFRVALEIALRRHDKGVQHGEHVWSYSRAEGSLVRARTREWRFSKEPSLPAGARVYRSILGGRTARGDFADIDMPIGGGGI